MNPHTIIRWEVQGDFVQTQWYSTDEYKPRPETVPHIGNGRLTFSLDVFSAVKVSLEKFPQWFEFVNELRGV